LVDYFTWHWIFLINIPIALAGIILSIRFLPDYSSEHPELDIRGFLLFGAASFLLSVALESLGNSFQITPILMSLMAGFLLLYFYYRHAKKQENPIFPLELFQVRTFRVGILGNMVTRLGISSVPLLLPLMIQIAYGQSAVVSGWIVAPMALTAMFGKSVVIPILNRIGYRKTLLANTLIIGFLICTLAIPGLGFSIYWHLPLIALLGFFNSIQFTSMNSIAIANLRPYHTSSGNSLVSVNQQLGMGFGIAFGLVVLKLFQGDVRLVQTEIHQSFRYTFLVIGSLTMLSGLVFRRLHVRDGDNLKSTT
jgi:MFS family permease